MPKLILASSSPYRHALLSRLHYPFSTFVPDIDETPLPDEKETQLASRLAQEKAKKAAQHHPQAVIIGSDEVVALGNHILGKPETKENARAQLMQMSNQKVFFHTGVCVYAPSYDYQETRLVTSAVLFRALTPAMIENYLEKEKPYQSAGSFKAETLGCALMHAFEGSDPTALIGLPLIALCEMLREVNIQVI